MTGRWLVRFAAWSIAVAVMSVFAAGAWQGRIPWLGSFAVDVAVLASWVNGRLDR